MALTSACSATKVLSSCLVPGQLVISYVQCGRGPLLNYSLFGNPVSFPLQVAKAVTQALNRCVSCLPGQRDVDNALRAVGDASKRLLSDSVGGHGISGLIL